MKRIIKILLLLIVSMTLISCNKKPKDPKDNNGSTNKDDNGVILDEEIWE